MALLGIVGCQAQGSDTGEKTSATRAELTEETAKPTPADEEHGLGLFGIAPARVVATGIPGAGAITQIGKYLPGGPFHDKPAFAASTVPGAILDSKRIFVASSSNFGAPLARPGDLPGSILSLDLSSGPVSVPANFASAGGQASAAAGAVKLYTAQSPAFLNSINNPGAVTRDLPAVSLPMGISINNGFGRPWFANAPQGSGGYGTITVIDPSGAPLAGAPDPVAGGVFAGDQTNRNAASTHGLSSPALATSLITESSDGSTKAVFFAALADGSVVQVHVAKGVDGLVPPGTFTPIDNINVDSVESADPHVITHVGMVFNWVPSRIVYVTDAKANRLVALDLSADGTLFHATPRYINSPVFDEPVDIVATMPEVAEGNFASGTTLGGGSDLYVLNRGNNSIVRIAQDGKVKGIRFIFAPLPGFSVKGIAVSTNGQKIYVTATAPGRQGVVLEVPAFGAGPIMPFVLADVNASPGEEPEALGASIFSHDFGVFQGVGPLFNGTACAACHINPIPGGMGNVTEFRVGRIDPHGNFDPLLGHGGPVARAHSISEQGFACGLPTGIPPQANAVSERNTMTLRGTGLIDQILDQDILANAATEPAAVQGHPNYLADGRIGRFGWKAQLASLVEFMGDAFTNEMGVTNPLSPNDLVKGCGASLIKPEVDAVPLVTTAAFLNTVNPPAPSAACLASPGATQFQAVGCTQCHTPSIRSAGTRAQLYSDLLLHDMGPGLADTVPQGSAAGNEWRTMPLWRLSDRNRFLHDGRASTVTDAILAHGGQAAPSAQAFQSLNSADRQALLDFLGCI